MPECNGEHGPSHCPREGMASEKGDMIQIWLRSAVRGGFGPAASEVEAAGVPAPAASARRPELARTSHQSLCG
jgi:hypothetical protein